MQIKPVQTSADAHDFLEVAVKLYSTNPNWTRPLDKDIHAVFDPKKNKFFRHGEAARWLLLDDNGQLIGRTAAFINKKLSHKEEQPTGGMGFFECIDNKEAAFFLFDTCKNWLAERGMEAMDGPVNFGERDNWWGLIVDGFDPPPYQMNYNPPYYKSLFEAYGFQVFFEQYCYSLKTQERQQEKFHEKHTEVSKDPDYKAVYLKKNQLAKFAEDFRTIYNKAWVRHGAGKELESKQVQVLFNKMKPVIDEKLIWYVYYKNEPVACWVNLPDINQIFRRFNGKFGLWQKLQFLYYFNRRSFDKMIGLVFGVVPEHQGKGVDSFMIIEGQKSLIEEKKYINMEMQWIGDFNPKMVSIAESLGTWRSRTLFTYRYLFDRTKEFKRFSFKRSREK